MKIIVSILIIFVGFLFNANDKKTTRDDLLKRETVEKIGYAKGIIRQIGNTDRFIIECGDKHLKLLALNLPEEYREADLEVLFSGNIKLTYPLEDEDGEFFEVRSIH